MTRPGYSLSGAGVTVDLTTGAAQGGYAEGDTLTGIEHVIGSQHADHLTGDSMSNQLQGLAGADTLDGGEGLDTVVYTSSDTGVTVRDGQLRDGDRAERDTPRATQSLGLRASKGRDMLTTGPATMGATTSGLGW